MVVGDSVGGGNVIALRSPSPLGPPRPMKEEVLAQGNNATTTPHSPTIVQHNHINIMWCMIV